MSYLHTEMWKWAPEERQLSSLFTSVRWNNQWHEANYKFYSLQTSFRVSATVVTSLHAGVD